MNAYEIKKVSLNRNNILLLIFLALVIDIIILLACLDFFYSRDNRTFFFTAFGFVQIPYWLIVWAAYVFINHNYDINNRCIGESIFTIDEFDNVQVRDIYKRKVVSFHKRDIFKVEIAFKSYFSFKKPFIINENLAYFIIKLKSGKSILTGYTDEVERAYNALLPPKTDAKNEG